MALGIKDKCEGETYQSMMMSVVTLNELVTTLTDHVANLKLSLAEMHVKVNEIAKENSEITTSLKIAHWQIKDNAEVQKELKNSFASTRTEMEHTKASIGHLESKLTKEIAHVVTSVEKTYSRIDKMDKEVKVINGEEKDGYGKCARVCAGTTGRSTTNWINYSSDGLRYDVDIKHCGFTKTPTITTSLEGTSNHWTASGTSSIYNASPSGFTMYLRHTARSGAKSRKWNVEWIAVGSTC